MEIMGNIRKSDLLEDWTKFKMRSRIKQPLLRFQVYLQIFVFKVSGRISLILGSNYLRPINTIDSIVLRSQKSLLSLMAQFFTSDFFGQ